MADPLEGLELVMTSDPLPSEAEAQSTAEAPKRRRGRPPKIVAASDDEPSTGASDKPRRTYTRRSADPCKQIEQLEEQIEGLLSGGYMLIGGAITMALPVTGTTIAVRAQAGAQAVIAAAKHNPTLATWLLKAMKTSAWAPMVIWASGVGVAAMIDIGAISPYNRLAQNTLGQDVLPLFAAQMAMQQQQQESPNGTVPFPNASSEAAQYSGE